MLENVLSHGGKNRLWELSYVGIDVGEQGKSSDDFHHKTGLQGRLDLRLEGTVSEDRGEKAKALRPDHIHSICLGERCSKAVSMPRAQRMRKKRSIGRGRR